VNVTVAFSCSGIQVKKLMKANLHSIQQYPSLSHSSYKVILKLHC